jgi:serine/threonine protein kinase
MPSTISRYRIGEELGRGGMGVVYRALDTRVEREVAIKILRTETTTDPEASRRFVEEACAASALNHPNIVGVHDVGEDDGVTFIAMELVEGMPLDRIIAQGPMPIADALECGSQIVNALGAAHANGIVHRSIKPADVMLTRDGSVKVLDFGVAALPGFIPSTTAYLSPEQAEGRRGDARSDVFSFGAVLYEMFAGDRPFAGNSEIDLITSIRRDAPPRLRGIRPETPAIVEGIVNRALAKDPAARYPTGTAMANDLDAALAARARPFDAVWRRRAFLVSAVVLLAALARTPIGLGPPSRPLAALHDCGHNL